MTIRQLELYSGVSNAYISQIERGERGIPSPDILKKLSKPLNIEYSELMKKAGYLDEMREINEDYEFDAIKRLSPEKLKKFKEFLEMDENMQESILEFVKKMKK